MSPVEIGLATPRDDADLRRLMASVPMDGAIRTAYAREPSFFDALCVEGNRSEVIVARDREAKTIVGLGCRSMKPVYINGVRSMVGYLSSLRGMREYRGSTLLARSYRFLRQRHEVDGPSLYLTTILEDNRVARDLLTSGRAGLPAYRDWGRFRAGAISLRGPNPFRNAAVCAVRCAGPRDLSSVVEFLNSEGRRKQFFPVYRKEDFGVAHGLLRGIRVEDLHLAYSGNELVGTAAVWDQGGFRQSRVTGYSRGVAMVRPLYNGFARVAGYPRLPASQSTMKYFHLSLVCVREDNPSILASLLNVIRVRYRGQYPFYVAGFHERDPLTECFDRTRHISLKSRLYVVCWEDGEEEFLSLDGRIPYLEIGAL